MVGGQWGDDPPKGGGKLYRLNEEGTSATFIYAIKVQRNTSNGTVTYQGRRTEMAFTADNQLIVLCIAPELYEGFIELFLVFTEEQSKNGFKEIKKNYQNQMMLILE